jgi:hypothetical protein
MLISFVRSEFSVFTGFVSSEYKRLFTVLCNFVDCKTKKLSFQSLSTDGYSWLFHLLLQFSDDNLAEKYLLFWHIKENIMLPILWDSQNH